MNIPNILKSRPEPARTASTFKLGCWWLSISITRKISSLTYPTCWCVRWIFWTFRLWTPCTCTFQWTQQLNPTVVTKSIIWSLNLKFTLCWSSAEPKYPSSWVSILPRMPFLKRMTLIPRKSSKLFRTNASSPSTKCTPKSLPKINDQHQMIYLKYFITILVS